MIKYKQEEEALYYLKDNYPSSDCEEILRSKNRLNLIECLVAVSYLGYLVAVVAICIYFYTVAIRAVGTWQFECIDTFLSVVKYSLISIPICFVLVIASTEVSRRTIGGKWTAFYNDYRERRFQ